MSETTELIVETEAETASAPVLSEKLPIICCVTGKTSEVRPLRDNSGPALPPGWKRHKSLIYSSDGWKSRFSLRTVRLPVARLESGDQQQRQGTWKRFREALRETQKQATQCLNWIADQLAISDVEPIVEGKLPKWSPPKHLYKAAGELFPAIDSQSRGILLQQVIDKFKEQRWPVRVLCKEQRARWCFPQPLPLIPKHAEVETGKDGLLIAIIKVGAERFRFVLESGYSPSGGDYRRAGKSLKTVLAGDGVFGEAKILEVSAPGSHRAGGVKRLGGNEGRTVQTRFVIDFTCWLPREIQVAEARTLVVATSKESLLTLCLEGSDRPWVLNEDHLPKMSARLPDMINRHSNRLYRLQQDQKLERRVPKEQATRFAGIRESLTEKHHRRLQDCVHKVSRIVTGFAERNRCTRIVWDDREGRNGDGFVPHFPWSKLRTLVEQKCREAGIAVEMRGEEKKEGGSG